MTITLISQASYVIGAANTSECPSGFGQIQDEGACKTAAALLRIVWNMSGAWFSRPRGCLKDVGNMVYFNTHASGSANLGHYPICKAWSRLIPATSP